MPAMQAPSHCKQQGVHDSRWGLELHRTPLSRWHGEICRGAIVLQAHFTFRRSRAFNCSMPRTELPQGFGASRPRLCRLSPVLKCPRAEFHFGKSRLFAWHCVVLLAGQLQDDRKQNAHGHGICQIRSTILGLMGAPWRPNRMSREG